MPINQNTLHHDRAEILGTVQFLFAQGAGTRADAALKGYLDLGNFTGAEFKAEAAKVEVLKCYRGVTRLGGNLPGKLTHGYDLTTNEVADARKLRFALLGDPDTPYGQVASANDPADALAFTAGAPAILNLWYPLTRGGGQVRGLTEVAIAKMTEGADFVVDRHLGLIRFTNPANLPEEAITPTVTAPAIDGAHPLGLKAVKPLTRGFFKGYGRLLVWDQDEQQPLVMDHQDFSCEVSLSSPPAIAAENLAEMKLLVTITGDTGVVFHRD
jgi:hypothetical protein